MTRIVALVIVVCAGVVGWHCGSSASNPLGGGESGDNRRPIISGVTVDPATIDRGGRASVVAVASDPDSDGVTFAFTARHGSLVVNPTLLGHAEYTHDSSATTADTVTVTVTDAKGASASASRAVDVRGSSPTSPSPTATPTPGGPLAVSVSAATSICHPADASSPCAVRCTATAAGGSGSYTYAWSGCAHGSGPSADCQVISISTHTCTVTVRDGAGSTAQGDAYVNGVNTAPTCAVSGSPIELTAGSSGMDWRNFTAFDLDGDRPSCGGPWVSPAGPFGLYATSCPAPDRLAFKASCLLSAVGSTGTMSLPIQDAWGAGATCNWTLQCLAP